MALALSACMKAPATNPTVSLDEGRYAHLSCEQLAAEQARLSIASALAEPRQKTSASETNTPTIAASENDGIDRAMSRKNCVKGAQPVVAAVAEQPSAKPAKVTR
jgi:hypothetical protein